MALVVAQEVPSSSSMAVPHGPAGVGKARRRMRDQLRVSGVCDTAVDDAVLILSELLSNACRHGRPLPQSASQDAGATAASDDSGDVLAAWRVDTAGRLTVEVTDGGGPTRPVPAKPSVTARGGRGLNIITALADDWGVKDDVRGGVTVWVVVCLSHVPAAAPDDLDGVDGAAGQSRAASRPPAGTGAPGAETNGRAATVGSTKGSSLRTSSGAGALHPHRPALGQPHRHSADRATRLASRPLSAFPDRDFPAPFDEQD